MLRMLLWPMALIVLAPSVVAFAGEDEKEETGITAGLIDEDARLGELDTFFYDVLMEEDEDVIDPAQAWQVQDLTVELDTLVITFADGEFYPRKKADDQVFALVYIGTGTYQFAPEMTIEQEELERLSKERAIDTTFEDAFIELSPQHLDQFKRGALPASGDDKRTKTAEKLWERRRTDMSALYAESDPAIAQYKVEGYQYFDMLRIATELPDVKKTVDSSVGTSSVFLYTWNVEDREEVSLARYSVNPMNELDAKYEVLCHFPRQVDREQLSAREIAYKDPTLIDVKHYDAAFEVYKNPDTKEWGLKGDTLVTYSPIIRDITILPLTLITSFSVGSAYTNPVDIKAVSDVAGNPLPYVHKSHMLMIELPEPAQKGKDYQVRVTYQGEIIGVISQPDPEMGIQEQSDATQSSPEFMNIVNYSLLNTYAWFPQNPQKMWDRYTWNWKFSVPKPMVIASSGTMVGQYEDGKNYVFDIRENQPAGLASVIFGRYSIVEDQPVEGQEPKRPLIRVFAHPGQLDEAKEILQQAHDIIDYYEELLQMPFPFPELDIAQMAYGVGFAQAPPGLIQMDGAAYLSKTLLATVYNVNDPFIREAFLPHEMGHQWWGHIIDSTTDHDYWMMEAGAEYSAALWGEASKGQAEYDKYVKYWQNRRGAKNTKKTMSLWLAASDRSDNRYIATIYGRGPLLMHELRQSLGFDKVVSVLRALLVEWKGGTVSTEDFQMVLEKATGMSFAAFFDMYVYHNEALGGVPEDVLQPK